MVNVALTKTLCGGIIIPILYSRKLRLRESKGFGQFHILFSIKIPQSIFSGRELRGAPSGETSLRYFIGYNEKGGQSPHLESLRNSRETAILRRAKLGYIVALHVLEISILYSKFLLSRNS